MDYEKKYNDALNLAKSNYGKGSNEFLDTIFPELAESEDEKFRKYILAVCKECVEANDKGLELSMSTTKKLLAYLEKQKPVQLEEEKEYIRTLKSRIADFLRGKDKDEVDTTYYQRICDWLDGRHVEQKEQDVEKYPEDKSFEDEWKDYYNNSLVSRRPMNKREVAKHFYWFVKKNAWKPSEEQMKALQNAVALTSCDKELVRLYNQLNKMKMEEGK